MHLVENSGKKQNIMVGNYVKENWEPLFVFDSSIEINF